MIRREINEWVKRQLFLPGTLVLQSISGKKLTVDARNDLANDQTMRLPPNGLLIAALKTGSLVTQPVTPTAALIAIPTVVYEFGVARVVGSTIVIDRIGYYSFTVQLHVEQGANSSIFKAWPRINGVAVTESAMLYEAKNAGDIGTLTATYIFSLAVGDVVDFWCNASIDASLNHTPAAAPAPGSFSASVLVMGYLSDDV